MQRQLNMVQEFRTKHGFSKASVAETPDLEWAASRILNIASDIKQPSFQLIAEEAGEILLSLAVGDRSGFVDGLADMLYVILGRAIEYDVDIIEAFERVHRSNMTKKVSNERCSDKGDVYTPPYLGDL